jgi:predicted DNA-binding mobile mystery protein A
MEVSMNTRLAELRLKQTDAMLAHYGPAATWVRPAGGWVRAIRGALGMSAAALARRVGMTPAGVHSLEKAEAQEVISVSSLKKLAEALDCELCYALVPRTSLEQTLKNRAMEVARARLGPVAHSMALEDQALEGKAEDLQTELLAKDILGSTRRALWS